MRRLLRATGFGLVSCLAFACGSPGDDVEASKSDFSSDQATLLDFEFDAELVTDSKQSEEKTIQAQLLYTIGALNTDRSVGRLDALELSNISQAPEGRRTRIRYHAKLPVAWASKTNFPSTYEFILPVDVSRRGISAFTAEHKTSCVGWDAYDVDAGSMWYYYRPREASCQLDPAEVVRVTATVTPSTLNTTGKYAEYHKIWEDNALEVIAIFGKYEDGAKSDDDGIGAYDSFVQSMKSALGVLGTLKTIPENVPDSPGVSAPDVEFNATLADGKTVKVTALLVDNVASTPPSFDERYEALSPTADLIAYNGHAGLGQNVRALARKGRFVAGKYQVFFMNGCDTFAYVDGSLAEVRAALNPDDPTGTKYMEFVTNAMPSFFVSMSDATMALFQGFLSYDAPKTYDQIFKEIDRTQVVLVTGEEDNEFKPGMPIGKHPQ